MIEIYGKAGCNKCAQAVNLCEQQGLDYSYKSLDTDFTREDIFDWFPGARTFPQIKISDQRIGGYDQLQQYVQNRKV